MEDHKVVDSKFRLVILAAKRAKQLLKGGRKKIETQVENPLSVALEEIKQGKIDFEVLMNDDFEKEAAENLFMMQNQEASEETMAEDDTEDGEEVVDCEDDEEVETDSQDESEDESEDD